MDTLLALWTDGLPAVETRDAASVAQVREEVRARAAAVGLPRAAGEALATVASELGHNQLRHARRGALVVGTFSRGDVPGVEVLAADEGPGIADVRAALRGEGASTAGGLGIGLASLGRLVDEFDLESHAGLGTCVRARKLAAPTWPRRQLAILGRPCRGESTSGDVARFVRDGDHLVLAMADGLGHGPLAREAALLGVHGLLTSTLEATDRRLVGTRGAVLARLTVDERTAAASWSTLGNLGARLLSRAKARALTSAAGYAGSGRPSKIVHEEVTLAAGEAVVLFTDGISSSAGWQVPAELGNGHPAFLAHHVLVTHGRDHDDQTIIVAR